MSDIIYSTYEKIIEKEFDVNKSPFLEKVVVMVTAAQGIIDNGGFDYFFEDQFEGNPDYEEFVKVFNEIGARESAEAIQKAIALNKQNRINKFEELDSIVIDQSKSNYQLQVPRHTLPALSNYSAARSRPACRHRRLASRPSRPRSATTRSPR